nr:hypothetical protein Iba_chr04aCG14550 [Ipomoea batatas]
MLRSTMTSWGAAWLNIEAGQDKRDATFDHTSLGLTIEMEDPKPRERCLHALDGEDQVDVDPHSLSAVDRAMMGSSPPARRVFLAVGVVKTRKGLVLILGEEELEAMVESLSDFGYGGADQIVDTTRSETEDFESSSVVDYTGARSSSGDFGSVTGDYGLFVEESELGPD